MDQEKITKLINAIDDYIDAKISEARARDDEYMTYSYSQDITKARIELEEILEEILKKP